MNKQVFLTFAVVIDDAKGMIDFCNAELNPLLKKNDISWMVFDRDSSPNDGESRELFAAIKKALGNRITYKQAQGTSVAECYNEALGIIQTPYLCLSTQHVHYNVDYYAALKEAHATQGELRVFHTDYRKARKRYHDEAVSEYGLLAQDLNTADKYHIFHQAYCFATSEAKKHTVPSICDEECGTAFLLKVLHACPEVVFASNVFCVYEDISRVSSAFYGCRNKDFYTASVTGFYIPFAQQCKVLPKWLQRAIFFQLYFKFYSNMNARDKLLLDKDEVQEFFSVVSDLLAFIDDDVILDNTQPVQYAPPLALRTAFLYLKYRDDEQALVPKYWLEGSSLYAELKSQRYLIEEEASLRVLALDSDGAVLTVYARYPEGRLFEGNSEILFAKAGNRKYIGSEYGAYSLTKVFGETIKRQHTWRFDIPLTDIAQSDSGLGFWLDLGGTLFQMPLLLTRVASKFNRYCPHSYWQCAESTYLAYQNKNLVLLHMDEAERARFENAYLRECEEYLVERATGKTLQEAQSIVVTARRNYYFYKEQYKDRRIWLYFDKLYKAGDNGEYAFRYAINNTDGIDCYYVVNEDAPDFDRLSKEFGDRIIPFGSQRCLLYALLAETIVATHPDIIQFFGYTSLTSSLVRDLFNANLVCIAHGVTIQKNADYQNKLFDYTMFYTTSSGYEVAHLKHPIYGYTDDEIALTGMARFDGLINDDKRQIMIAPTWRNNLVGTAKRNTVRSYNPEFKSSSYYRIYNDLINDDRLVQAARETGYRILFVLHPQMSAQIDDFEVNDYVDIVPASGDMSYETVLRQSSLLVTDYSGIHFDFGYMRKPVVYYQPVEVPMRFEEGGMKFATMGFGPLCSEYEDAVSLICEYMRNDCRMPEEYKRRCDDFFEFDDQDNAKRIYEAILAWANKKMSSRCVEVYDPVNPHAFVEPVTEQARHAHVPSIVRRVGSKVRRITKRAFS